MTTPEPHGSKKDKTKYVLWKGGYYDPYLTPAGALAILVNGKKNLLSSFPKAEAEQNPHFFVASQSGTSKRTVYRVRAARIKEFAKRVDITEKKSDKKEEEEEEEEKRTASSKERQDKSKEKRVGSGGRVSVRKKPVHKPREEEVKEEVKTRRRPVRRVGDRELLGLEEIKIPLERCRTELATAKRDRLRASTSHRMELQDEEKKRLTLSVSLQHEKEQKREVEQRLERAKEEQQKKVNQLQSHLETCRTALLVSSDTEDAQKTELRLETKKLQTLVSNLESELAQTRALKTCPGYKTLKEAEELLTRIGDRHPDLVLFQDGDANPSRLSWRSTPHERAVEEERKRMKWIKLLDVGDHVNGYQILPPFFASGDIHRRQQPTAATPHVGRGAYIGQGAFGVVFAAYDMRAPPTKTELVDWDRAGEGGPITGRFLHTSRLKALKIVTSQRDDLDISVDMVVESLLMNALVHPNLMHTEMVRSRCVIEYGKGWRRSYVDAGVVEEEEEKEKEKKERKEEEEEEVQKDTLPSGLLLLVMPLGITLDDWIQRYPEEASNPAIVLRVMEEIHCGAKQLWQNKVTHQDFKPSNVLMLQRFTGATKEESESKSSSSSGLMSQFRPVISDFGLAKQYFKRQSLSPTTGTLYYMAPERLLSERILAGTLDVPPPPASDFDDFVAADMWSLGCIFWWLLFNQTDPFAFTAKDEQFATSDQVEIPQRLLDRVLLFRNIEKCLSEKNQPAFFREWLSHNEPQLTEFLADSQSQAIERDAHVWANISTLRLPSNDVDDETFALEREKLMRILPPTTDYDAAVQGFSILFDGIFKWHHRGDRSNTKKKKKNKKERKETKEEEEEEEEEEEKKNKRVVDFSGFDRAPTVWHTRSNGRRVPPLVCRVETQLKSLSLTKKKRVATTKSGAEDPKDTSYGPIVFGNIKNLRGIAPKIVEQANEILYRYICTTKRAPFEEVATDFWLQLAAFVIAAKAYRKTPRGYLVRTLQRNVENTGDVEQLKKEERDEIDIYQTVARWSSLSPHQRSLVYDAEERIMTTLNWDIDSRVFVCNNLDDVRHGAV